MIVRAEDFEARPHPILSDPGLPEDMKRQLKEIGLADTLNRVELLEIADECFKCGGKLATPYLYWNGAMGGLSLHPKCAADLALGLVQDTHELDTGTRCVSKTEATEWLGIYAQKRDYGVEDD